MADLKDMIGETMLRVENLRDEELHFTTKGGRKFKLYHEQDCCEHVYIESIVGDLEDLVGEPLLIVEEAIGENATVDYESETWTFYKFATRKGFVDVRWVGRSNGYYSESVDFEEEKDKNA